MHLTEVDRRPFGGKGSPWSNSRVKREIPRTGNGEREGAVSVFEGSSGVSRFSRVRPCRILPNRINLHSRSAWLTTDVWQTNYKTSRNFFAAELITRKLISWSRPRSRIIPARPIETHNRPRFTFCRLISFQSLECSSDGELKMHWSKIPYF